MAVTVTEEVRKRAIGSIQRYFDEDLDQEIGELKAGMVLDFFLAELAPIAYNAAINDAQVYLRDRVADLEGVCAEPEFGYWPVNTVRRKL